MASIFFGFSTGGGGGGSSFFLGIAYGPVSLCGPPAAGGGSCCCPLGGAAWAGWSCPLARIGDNVKITKVVVRAGISTRASMERMALHRRKPV